MVERREAEDAAKLEALRAAAFDRGAFEEFADAAALVAHLNELADHAAPARGRIDGDGLAHSSRRRGRERFHPHPAKHQG